MPSEWSRFANGTWNRRAVRPGDLSGPLIEALGKAWASVSTADHVATAFTQLNRNTALDMQWPGGHGQNPNITTKTLTIGSIRMGDFTIQGIEEIKKGGTPAFDARSREARFPIHISSATVSANVETRPSGREDQESPPARLVLKFAPLRCDFLGKIGDDQITGRPYAIVYGFDVRSPRVSFAELVDPAGTDQMDVLDLILSDPRFQGGMKSAIALLIRSSLKLDAIHVEINKALIQSWPVLRVGTDALSLAATSHSDLSVRALERIARSYGMEDHFGVVGAPDIQPVFAGWNACLQQRFATAMPDGTISRKIVTVAFRVLRSGQVVTMVTM